MFNLKIKAFWFTNSNKMFLISRNSSNAVILGMFIHNSKRIFNNSNINNVYVKNTGYSLVRQCLRRYCSSINTEHAEEEINFDSVSNGDKEIEHKLKIILLEAEVMRQEGRFIPDNTFLTTKHWQELVNLPSRNARRRYFEYLFKLSKKKENKKAKQAEKKLHREEYVLSKPEKSESLEEFALKYDLSHNNIFLRFYESTMNQLYNHQLIRAMMFGQKVVVDCGYEENMTVRENKNCAKQLMLLFSENRIHNDPFDLHYCNMNPNGSLLKLLSSYIPTMSEPSFPLNVHQSSYLDLFPKDKLVYLTPHCRQEMTCFDHDAIYIIGGIVDKVNNEPLSLAKAKKEGLKMAKFPLDKYLQWSSGSGKSLTLNQVVSILNDVKLKGDWNFALRHVPKRKIIDYSDESNINKIVKKQQPERNIREKRWIPASNIDFKVLNYNKSEREQ